MSLPPPARPLPRRRAARPLAEALERRTLLTVNNPSVAEGGPGTTADLVFTVSFTIPVLQELDVNYETVDGTATAAGGDYTPVADTLVFIGVNRSQQVHVTVRGDALVEANETVFLDLYNADTGDFLGRGTGTILNDDAYQPPQVTSFTDSPDPVQHGQPLTLSAAVSDPDGDMARVDFFRESDGNPGLSAADAVLGSDATAPYEWTTSIAALPAGTYTYYARAVDAQGLIGAVASTTNTVVNAPPHIDAFTDSPATVIPPGNLTLSATVTDAEGDPLSGEFYRETNGAAGLQRTATQTRPADTLLGTFAGAPGGSPFTWTGSVVDLPEGNYTYYVSVSDGTDRVSASLSNTVSRPKPVVTSLAVSPDPVDAGSPVTLSAGGVSDPRNLPLAVEFYRESNGTAGFQAGAGGDTFLGSDGVGRDVFTLTVPTTGLAFGSYTYYARPVNNVGTAGNVVSAVGTLVHPPPVIASLTASPEPVYRGHDLTLTANGVTDPEGAADVVSVSFYRESNGTAGLQTGAGGDVLLGADGIGTDGYSITVPTIAPGLPATGASTYYARAVDQSGTTGNVVSAVSTILPVRVVGRWVFYNHSAFDGHDAGANAADDAAIAPDKTALLPGQAATAANVTGYSRGINGVMVDVEGLGQAFDPARQQFDFNGTADPSAFSSPASWPRLPDPQVTVRRGAGVGGSDRVTLTWPDGAVRNTWLRVGVRAGTGSGLSAPDIFFFGNLVGETGEPAGAAPAGFRVDAADVLAVRRAISPRAAGLTSRYDLNRDGVVNVLDEAVARPNQGHALAPLSVSIAAASVSVSRPAPQRRPRGDYLSTLLQ